MHAYESRNRRRAVIVLAGAAIVMTASCWPTTRLVGVNFAVTEQRLPLWVKTIEFIDRDVNLAQTARAVLGGVDGGEAKAASALAWTRAAIRNAPPGLPVVDDHIWHIIIRGYGQPDQLADVFTSLLVYQGVPAYWALVGTAREEIPISYVWIRGRWRVYDVARGLVFRNRGGDLASPDEIAADHALIGTAAAGLPDVDAYVERFAGYSVPVAPDTLRADLQMPGRRLWFETRKVFGRQGHESQMHPVTEPPRAEVRTP